MSPFAVLCRTLATLALSITVAAAHADPGGCDRGAGPRISFIQFSSPNLLAPSQPLTIKGKLSLPAHGDHHCAAARARKLPAVVILHGSSGVDARGDFYETALNEAGIATLQIDMWEARGVASAADRPKAPILTYADAFSALAFLAAQPNIDAARIGVLGFSWGGVMSLETSELLYAGMFGGGRQFKAHVAHYPVCYAANKQFPGLPPPAQFGSQYLNPTGARVLIQIGSLDDYDNGAAPCRALAQSVNGAGRPLIEVVEYANALHAFDRLMVPIVVNDPFGDQGSIFQTGVAPTVRIGPDVPAAFAARERAVRFFRRNL
jgi:dienelactone hydrolase